MRFRKERDSRLQGALKNQVRLRDGRDWEIESTGGPGCELCYGRLLVCGDLSSAFLLALFLSSGDFILVFKGLREMEVLSCVNYVN